MMWFVGILLLLAALLLESGLLAYCAYVLLGLLLLSRLLARSWVNNLSAERSVAVAAGTEDESPPHGLAVEIGDRVTVSVIVRNGGFLPVPWVLLEDLLPRHALDKRFPRLRVKGKRLQIAMMGGHGETTVRYTLECLMRGSYAIGPLVLEGGDLFGLHRRWPGVLTKPRYLLVYPKVVPLLGFEIASRRPIGDVRLSHRLFEDPTRLAGVRPYEPGDPLNRIHWKATARTGTLHSKICEPSTLVGATIVLDFHQAGYPRRGEPFRSELAVTAAVSLANAVQELGQQVGLVTNGGDAAERLRTAPWPEEAGGRAAARAAADVEEKEGEGLRVLRVDTRRGADQVQHIRELLARVEPADGLTFAELLIEATSRLPRDATVLAVLPDVPVATAIALGTLRRAGFAVSVVLVLIDEAAIEQAHGRLLAEGLRDIRHLKDEAELPDLVRRQVDRSAPYALADG